MKSEEWWLDSSEQELQSLQTMVATALGLDSERGDKINILSLPFTEPSTDPLLADGAPSALIYQYLPAIKIGFIALAVLGLYLLLVRPIVKTMKGEVEEHYKTVEELEKERHESLTEQEEEELSEIVEDAAVILRREVMKDPTPTAYVLKNWIQET